MKAGPPKINEARRKFAERYAEHGVAARAYRECFDANGMTPESVARKAYELLQVPELRSIIDSIQAKTRERALLSIEQHVKDLQNLRDLAVANGKFAAAVTAEIARGKVAGFHVERHIHKSEVSLITKSAAELSDDELATIAAANADTSTSGT